jgi:outer membrane protein assembly factor BamB
MFQRVTWERPLHQGGLITALAVTPHHVVVHERRSRLVCLGRQDGAALWDIPIGTHPRAVIVAGERILVITQDADRLSCINAPTGTLLWSVDLPRFTGHLVATTDTVIVGGWRGYTPLAAFDLETGTLRWEGHKHANTVLPVAIGNGVLIGAPGATEIQLIEPHDGQTLSRWQVPEPLAESDTNSSFTPTGAGRFFVRCGSRTVASIDLSSSAVDAIFHHDADLAPTAAELTAAALWLRELRGGYLAVDPVHGNVH